jgi:hypothetical protein
VNSLGSARGLDVLSVCERNQHKSLSLSLSLALSFVCVNCVILSAAKSDKFSNLEEVLKLPKTQFNPPSCIFHTFSCNFYLYLKLSIFFVLLLIFESRGSKTQDSFEKIRKIRKVYRDIKSGFVSKKFINNFLDFFKNLKLLCVYLLS